MGFKFSTWHDSLSFRRLAKRGWRNLLFAHIVDAARRQQVPLRLRRLGMTNIEHKKAAGMFSGRLRETNTHDLLNSHGQWNGLNWSPRPVRSRRACTRDGDGIRTDRGAWGLHFLAQLRRSAVLKFTFPRGSWSS